MNRLPELEGLRGLLAWWVVWSHLCFLSGAQSNSFLFRLQDPDTAVFIFVILSGFVIFALLERRELTVPQFLIRRFFRLWPTFLACFALSIALFPLERANMASHLQSAETVAYYAARHGEWAAHLLEHATASLTFTHGMVPRSVLPDADRAFLMAGWSIALEWQFYLLAPLLFVLLHNSTQRVQILAFGVLTLVAVAGTRLAWNTSALPGYLRYFGVGLVSFYAWRALRQATDWRLAAGAYLVAFPFLDLALRIWLLVLLSLCAPAPGTERLRAFLASRWLVAVGKVSYSTYLVHWPLLTVFTWLQLKVLRLSSWQAVAVGAVTAFPVIFFASTLLYRWVEQPGIKLGGRILARTPAQRQAQQ